MTEPGQLATSETPEPTMRDKVDRLERELRQLPQAHCEIRHFFAPGLYAREITIPAGVAVTGAPHKTDNLIIVSRGRLRIVTESGVLEACAGDTILCKAGMKNAVVALEESRWTNFLANPDNITDPVKLVEIFTEACASELLGGKDNKQLLTQAAMNQLEA